MDLRLVGGKLLRCGYTTGVCAAAAAKAACIMLLTQAVCETVTLTTPKGIVLTLDVLNVDFTDYYASCAVRKDSGDDPDVTDGILVYARVERSPDGILIDGANGVGRVTKPGLDQPVGAAAINSVPRGMITNSLRETAEQYGYTGGFSVKISIPGGAELAKRTFNPRIGIEGGLSVIGTTGIVEPMSHKAMADTIRTELSVLYSAGHREVVLTVGNYSEAFARDMLHLPLDSLLKCSNFIGETLAAAAEKGFTRAILVGHIGKIVKLGIGALNTHSHFVDGRMETLITCALEAGASLETLREIRGCVSTDAALDCLREVELLDAVMSFLRARVGDTLTRHVAGHLKVNVICFGGLGETTKELFRI